MNIHSQRSREYENEILPQPLKKENSDENKISSYNCQTQKNDNSVRDLQYRKNE